jgi:hypothetical protein
MEKIGEGRYGTLYDNNGQYLWQSNAHRFGKPALRTAEEAYQDVLNSAADDYEISLAHALRDDMNAILTRAGRPTSTMEGASNYASLRARLG